jgi:hypothetical protein
MSLDLNTTELAIALAAGIAGAAYVFFIVIPAVRAYGRVWERLAAGFLTIYIVATLLGIGAVVGLAVVWSYDRYA